MEHYPAGSTSEDVYTVVIKGWTQGSKLTFLLGSTGAPNFKKLGAPQLF